MQKPSQRDIEEERDRINTEVENDASAKFNGNNPPVRPRWPNIRGKERLLAGQWMCCGCPIRPHRRGAILGFVVEEKPPATPHTLHICPHAMLPVRLPANIPQHGPRHLLANTQQQQFSTTPCTTHLLLEGEAGEEAGQF